MKKTRNRTLSLLLALVLAVSLAVPAAAAVSVTGVSLSQTNVTLVPKETVTLTATVSPKDATNQAVTWSSNKETIATVSSQGVVTAVAAGVADITAKTADGSYSAVCTVTVEEDSVTGVTITPAGPEVLPVGKQRQLEATVTYAHGSDKDQTVTWVSETPSVATVTDTGLVTAVGEGETEIFAISNGKNAAGQPVMKSYRLTVGKTSDTSPNDVLSLSPIYVNADAGQYVDTRLQAPQVTVKNGSKDVTDAYTFTYTWTDSAKKPLGTGQDLVLQPTTLGGMVVVCTVTATSKTDSTQTLSGSCSYSLTVYASTTLGATLPLDQGTTTLEKLTDLEGKQSLLDQLTLGGDTDLTPAIPGLTHVIFDLNSVTGEAVGTLNVKDQQAYFLREWGDAALLSDVTFTPRQAGTYSIQFLAYGDKPYYGQLEIIVSSPTQPPVAADRQCDTTGFPFAGSDFFQPSDTDPVVSVVFGAPSAGKLVRDLAYGSGIPDQGDRYYTNSASKGDFHVSTLSYLPPAGFSGYDAIPMTLTTQSGKVTTATLSVYVVDKVRSDHFSDVTEGDVGTWAASAVDFAHHFGLVNGIEETLFGPNEPMTRAQLVTILYRAAGSPQVAITTNFEDLDVGGYYYNAVVWANAISVVNGLSDTAFGPDEFITREQIATILYRYAEATGGNTLTTGTLNSFMDKGSVSAWAAPAMTWAVSQGIISGTTETTLSPLSSATRAQVVVMLHRYLAN